ncbi:MAG TPA: AI-2E family transporter, partial [Geminicoccaceae bacterium]|nr:AI-2E family transporter [Geminicoccaceae bacterium]
MSEPPPAPGGGRGRALPARVALAAAGLLLWQLAHVLLMAFAAILVALLLRAFAELIGRWLPVGEAGALVLAGLAIAAVLGGFAWVLGAQLLAQATELLDRAPELVRNLEQRLGVTGGEAWLAGQAQDAVEAGGLLGRLLRVSASLIGGVAGAFLVVIGGIHLAVRPRLYRQGVLLLLPPRLQGRAAAALDAVARALKLWLLGQLVAMLLVGCLTTLGLWLLGVPSALALGFMAGMSEFVPVVGPIAAAVPAVALALAE